MQTTVDARALGMALLLGLAAPPASAQAPPPPAGMVGELRELHQVGRLPRYRTGSEVAQVSSYDTTGGNNDGFQGTYSYVRREGESLVLADLTGPGVVHRIWTPTPTDRMLAFYFDGEETPRLRLPFLELFSGSTPPFVSPVVGNEVGGYYSYLPIPYARSLKIVYEGDDIRFHQIQYRSYPPGTSVESFRIPLPPEATEELAQVVDAWSRPGERPWVGGGTRVEERAFTLRSGQQLDIFRLDRGGRILGVEVERTPDASPPGAALLLEARWDGQSAPAILAPVDVFFGYAFGDAAAQGFLLGSRAGRDYAYLPMPFDRSAVLSLRSLHSLEGTVRGTTRVFYTFEARDSASEGRLYATWRRERSPSQGEPYLIVEASGRGHHVGTLLQAQGLEPGMTTFFEGDDVTTVDGEMRLHGTGSEDYFNGGWYALLDRWDQGMSLPLHGALDYSLPQARTGGYRFYLADKVSFEKQLRLTIEHGPEGNRVPVDYTSLAFHYGEVPSTAAVDPAEAPPPARPPTEHQFYPQLLQLSTWFGTTTSFVDGALEVSAEESGLVRFDVSALTPGRYRVRLSYRLGPDGAVFSVWRRQVQLSPWVDTHAQEGRRVEGADMGELELTAQARTVTIRIRARPGRNTIRIDRLVLEEIP
ncbi:MAG: DUF2961 domain-containing protein [Gemmatimonadota bacterium]